MTAIGKMIDAYLCSESELDDHSIHHLFSANRWELVCAHPFHPEPCLISSVLIAIDRPSKHTSHREQPSSRIAMPSLVSHSQLKRVPISTSYEWCKAPEVGLPAPDLTLFLDINPEVAMQRGGMARIGMKKQEVQARVRQIFERIGKEMGNDQ